MVFVTIEGVMCVTAIGSERNGCEGCAGDVEVAEGICAITALDGVAAQSMLEFGLRAKNTWRRYAVLHASSVLLALAVQPTHAPLLLLLLSLLLLPVGTVHRLRRDLQTTILRGRMQTALQRITQRYLAAVAKLDHRRATGSRFEVEPEASSLVYVRRAALVFSKRAAGRGAAVQR